MSASPIAAHRLLGDGQSAALLRPGGELDWWCAPDMDSPPLLWSLLDDDGAAARWLGTRLTASSGRAAGSGLMTLEAARGMYLLETEDLRRKWGTAAVVVRRLVHRTRSRRRVR